MLFTIDRSMLRAINRRASEILRGDDQNTGAADAGEWPQLRIELTREDIRAAAAIAQQRLGWPAPPATMIGNVADNNDLEV